MPLQRRLPKRGFKSPIARYSAQVTLSDLNRMQEDEIDMLTLKAHGLVPDLSRTVKVIASGAIARAVKLQGMLATKGARSAIEAAGGSVADIATSA